MDVIKLVVAGELLVTIAFAAGFFIRGIHFIPNKCRVISSCSSNLIQ